jgi:hypothetical protein
VAASHHGDTPYSGNSVTPVPVTPYTTSVDVNEDDPGRWSYGALAAAIGCSKELIAAIVKGCGSSGVMQRKEF